MHAVRAHQPAITPSLVHFFTFSPVQPRLHAVSGPQSPFLS
jgi:hypothetical protein